MQAQGPICVELSPTKVSPAGLVGASHPIGNGWRSTPGAFAQASGGVVVLQDAHGWSKSRVREVAPVLQELMEDGEVRDSVAGGAKLAATTATIIDLNRTQQVIFGFAPEPEAPLLGIRPLLSRCDLLIELPGDADQVWAVGRAMCGAIGRNRPKPDNDPEVRELRLLVGALRDRHPCVDLDPIRTALVNTFDKIYAANRDLFKTHPEAGDLPTRLTITFARLISASARGMTETKHNSKTSLRPQSMSTRSSHSFACMRLRSLRGLHPGPTLPTGLQGMPVRTSGQGTSAGNMQRLLDATSASVLLSGVFKRQAGSLLGKESTVFLAAPSRQVDKWTWTDEPYTWMPLVNRCPVVQLARRKLEELSRNQIWVSEGEVSSMSQDGCCFVPLCDSKRIF